MPNALDNLLEGLKQGYMDSGGVTPANVFSGVTPRDGDAPAGFSGGAGDFLGSLFGHVSDLAVRTLPEVIKDPASFVNDRGELSITRVLFPDFRREKVKEGKSREEMRKAALAASVISQGHTQLQDLLSLHTSEGRTAGADVYGGEMNPQATAALNAANAEAAGGKRGAAAAGLLPEIAALAMPEDALKAGQSQFTDRLAREQNTQQHGYTLAEQAHGGVVTRQNQANASGLAAGNIRLRDKLATDRQTKFGAKGGDPYPVLEEMVNTGVFKDNPMALSAAAAHLARRTDPKNAGDLVQQWQQGIKPTTADGVPSTSRERVGQTYLKDLKLRKRAGMVPTGMEREAKMTLRSKNPTGAQQLLARMNDRAAGNVKGESTVEAAKKYVTSPEFGSQTPAMQGIIQEALANDDAATLAGIWPKVVSHDEAGVRAVLADPRFKKIKEEASALQDTKRGLALSLEAASIPGRPGQIRKDLFGPYLSLLPDEMVAQYGNLTQNPEWQSAKQGLQSAGGLSLSSFILGRSGKQSSDKEYGRLRAAWPFGNEVSDTVYLAKLHAVERATAATETMMKREAELIAQSGLDPEGQIAAAFGTAEGQRIRTSLIEELEHITTAQADQMPDRPLTPEQQAEMNGGR